MSFTWNPRLVKTPTPIMSAMTTAVAVDAVTRFELPLLAGIIWLLATWEPVYRFRPFVAPSRERIRRSTHARSTPDDLENPKARSASEAAISLRQTMQVLQGRAAQHVAGQGEAAADCGGRPRSRCRIPVVVTKLPACNSLRAPRSAPCSVRATPTSCPHRAFKTYNMNRPMAVALEPQTPQIRC